MEDPTVADLYATVTIDDANNEPEVRQEVSNALALVLRRPPNINLFILRPRLARQNIRFIHIFSYRRYIQKESNAMYRGLVDFSSPTR